MRYILLILMLSGTAWGQAISPERAKINAALQGDHLPVGWFVSIVNDSEWNELAATRHITSAAAFTVMPTHMTFIRASYVQYASTSELRHTLFHEMGHLHFNTHEERLAETWARLHDR